MTALSPATLQLLNHLPALCNMVRRVAIAAGDHTLTFFDESGYAADTKADGSPVTEADRAAERIVIDGLRVIAADIPVVAEEAASSGDIPDLTGADYFWLVDPLDGTREFVRGSGDYTVNIGLIHNGVPVLGVIYAPVAGELYAGHGAGTALRWLADSGTEKKIRVRDLPAAGLTVIAGRHSKPPVRLHAFIEEFKVAKVVHKGSSLKLCAVAAGKADLYPRLGETSEWDTAAGDAILRAAGGQIVDLNGAPLSYGHAERNFINPAFVASSGFWPVEGSD